jgi:DNA invertase Pin-like site-specific DNA recombinase
MATITTRAICYSRVSTLDQETSGLSLDHQARALRDECERRGWAIVRELVDVASAKALTGRPMLAEALDALQRGEADVLVVTRLDRLSRSTADFVNLLDRGRREGWRVLVLDAEIDFSTASGEMVGTVLAAMSTFERRLIAIRTSEALQAAKAKGQRLGRPRVMPAATQALVMDLHGRGWGLTKVAQALNAQAVPTARGGAKWYPASVLKVIRSHALDAEALALSAS